MRDNYSTIDKIIAEKQSKQNKELREKIKEKLRSMVKFEGMTVEKTTDQILALIQGPDKDIKQLR